MYFSYKEEKYIDLDGQELTKTTWGGTTEYKNKNGKIHRWSGPAIIHPHGEVEYWIEGKEVGEKRYIDLIWLKEQIQQ